jgi:hypothetical protein
MEIEKSARGTVQAPLENFVEKKDLEVAGIQDQYSSIRVEDIWCDVNVVIGRARWMGKIWRASELVNTLRWNLVLAC